MLDEGAAMGSLAATIFAHAIFACVVGVLPWRGVLRYRRLKREVAAGDLDAKVRFYRATVVFQSCVIAIVLCFWLVAGVPAAWLGLTLPNRWGVTLGMSAIVVLALATSVRAFRTGGDRQLRQLVKVAGAMLPLSTRERWWFVALSFGAGISEEMLARGFVIFYLWQYLPGQDVTWMAWGSGLVFGVGHLYQGWRHVIVYTVLGACLAWFYLITGSLVGPMIVHAAIDLRIAVIMTTARFQALTAESAIKTPS
jgi:membrane protease YdiL (CAAX protease family)